MPCQPQSAVGLWGSRQECSKTGSCGPCVCGDTFDQWSEEAAGCRPGGCVRVKGRDKESPPPWLSPTVTLEAVKWAQRQRKDMALSTFWPLAGQVYVTGDVSLEMSGQESHEMSHTTVRKYSLGSLPGQRRGLHSALVQGSWGEMNESRVVTMATLSCASGLLHPQGNNCAWATQLLACSLPPTLLS